MTFKSINQYLSHTDVHTRAHTQTHREILINNTTQGHKAQHRLHLVGQVRVGHQVTLSHDHTCNTQNGKLSTWNELCAYDTI